MSNIARILSTYDFPREHVLPNPHTFTIIINERQRQRIVAALMDSSAAAEDCDADECQMDMFLADMFISASFLQHSPTVNSFVL